MSHDVTQTERAGTDDRGPDLEHVTVTCPDGPDECAIFPRETTENTSLRRWITAQGESFVDLESMR